jgi:hypothetical protein
MTIAFSLLTAAELGHAAWWILHPQSGLWCGNVVSDPLHLNLSILAPLAAGSILAMAWLCGASGRWPLLCRFALVLFVVAQVALLAATRVVVVEYGLPIGRIWWLPGFAQRWLLGS